MPRAKKAKKPVENPRLPATFDREVLSKPLKSFTRPVGMGTWTHERVDAAIDAQFRGIFREPVALGRRIFTDPAIMRAGINRLAPHRGLPREVQAPKGSKPFEGTPLAIMIEAQLTFASVSSVALPSGVLSDVFRQLAVHEISICHVHWVQRPDGSRFDPFVTLWDLEAVEWDEHQRKLFALTTQGRVEIEHGNGRWIVFAKSSDRPWTMGGLISLAGVWTDTAWGRRYQGQNAESHGDDKWLGELPPGIAIKSPEGKAFLNEMIMLYEQRRAMLIPHGGKVTRSESMGANWQIFKNQIDTGTKDAGGVFVGQDGSVVDSGGNYIKSRQLYGVRNDIVEGDLTCVSGALGTGLFRPWSKMNFNRWDRFELVYLMPDADEDQRVESLAKRRALFWEDVAAARDSKLVIVDQAYFDERASEYRIVAPKFSPPASQAAAAPAPERPRAVA